MIIFDYQEELAQWAANKLQTQFFPPYVAIGATDNATGNLIAVFIFNNYTGNDVEVTVAADRIPRELLKVTYRYVVGQLGCQRASYRTRADNLPAQKCLERLGARKEGVQRRYFGDCDSFMYGILQEDFPNAFTVPPDAA